MLKAKSDLKLSICTLGWLSGHGRLARHSWAGRPCHLVFLILPLALLTPGCQFAPKPSTKAWPWQKDTAKKPPDRILPVWTDSVLHQPNQPGVRGFGGRVYFYGKENTDPVEVDGSFAVYVFDADDNAPSDQRPLRKFVFTADQFKTHMSRTSMGPSYSVWIPWGEVGGAPRRLSLISRFEGREGGTTISDPTIKILPGVPTNKEIDKSQDSAKSNQSPVSLAGHADSSSPTLNKVQSAEKSKIESIDLPPAFQRHLLVPKAAFEASKGVERNMPIPQPVLDSSASLKLHETRSDDSRATGSREALPVPITTQVYDYRTRGHQRSSTAFSSKQSKMDIRDGRWIQSISRSDKND